MKVFLEDSFSQTVLKVESDAIMALVRRFCTKNKYKYISYKNS